MPLYLVYFAGLATSFTPCVLPMLPITLALFINDGKNTSSFRRFIKSLFYVLGMAISYALLGVVAASTGKAFGSFLGNKWVIISICLFFILMGLSMFGLFNLDIPEKLKVKIQKLGSSNSLLGIFLAGAGAGFVAGPCVGPVLVSILAMVAKTQNLWLGFINLFVFAIGLGTLFFILGCFSHLINKLPKAGNWMTYVKYLLGIACFVAAGYYSKPLWANKISTNNENAAYSNKNIDWITINTSDISSIVKTHNKPAIVDFWATWCIACIEFEKITFPNQKIQSLKDDFIWLKFDATETSKAFEQIQEKYEVFGLPTILFFNSSGELIPEQTVTGFEKAAKFEQRMKSVLGK